MYNLDKVRQVEQPAHKKVHIFRRKQNEEDQRYSDWVIMEDFLPATSTGGDIMVAANPAAAAWLDVVGGAKFYPTAMAEWADVKQGVIDVQQQALLGGDVQELLDELQAEIAG